MRADPFIFRLLDGLARGFILAASAGGLLLGLLAAFGWFAPLGRTQFTLEIWQGLFAAPGFWRGVMLSLWVGFAASALSLAITFAILADAQGRAWFSWLRHGLAPLLSVPHAAVALGFAFVFAPSGLLFRLLGFDTPPDVASIRDAYGLALIAGLVLKEVPFLFLVSLAGLPQLRPDIRMASARMLGYGRRTAFLKAVAPGLYPLIRLPFFAVIAYSAAPPEMALILGPQEPPLLVVSLLRMMQSPELDTRLAANAGAMVQLGIVLLLLMVWWLVETCAPRGLVSNGSRHAGALAVALIAKIAGAFILLSAGLALVSLVLWSLALSWRFPALLPQGLQWQTWAGALWQAGPPLLASLWLAAASAFTGLWLAVAGLMRQRPDGFDYAPLILPQLALLMGLQMLPLPPSAFGFMVFLAHVLFVLPYVRLSLVGPWRNLDGRYAQVAQSLGAGPMAVFFRVQLPLLTGPLLTAFAVGFAVSVGLYLPSLMISGGRLVTITTEAVALSSGGDRRVIAAYGLLQAILPFTGFALAALLPPLLFRHRAGMRGK